MTRIAAAEIRDVHVVRRRRLVALARSTSHFAALDEARQAVGEQQIRALVGRSGTVELPYAVELSAFASGSDDEPLIEARAHLVLELGEVVLGEPERVGCTLVRPCG